MKILIVHQNFPGQYLHLARYLGTIGKHEVVFITQRRDASLPGVRKIVYAPSRPVTASTHHYLRETEAGVLNAQAVARVALDLKNAGFVPDVMLGHNGWGEIWYLKEIFPRAPLIGYFEFFYRLTGADVGFNPQEVATFDTGPRLRTKNVGNLLGLECVDTGQCPTRWQQSVYPKRYHSRLRVVHEGINTRTVAPNVTATVKLPNSDVALKAGDEVLTYVARNLEPYRGVISFMKSLPAILSQRPQAQVIVIGGDEVSYGTARPDGKTYRQALLEELDGSLDLSRIHFLGKIPYDMFLSVLQISRAHIYLTYPFVLSWSMLEAMSAGCLVIGSKTAPVEEVIRHEDNGILVDFFSTDEIASRAIDVLADPHAHDMIRTRARQTIIDRYDLHSLCLPAQLKLLHEVIDPPHSALWTPN